MLMWIIAVVIIILAILYQRLLVCYICIPYYIYTYNKTKQHVAYLHSKIEEFTRLGLITELDDIKENIKKNEEVMRKTKIKFDKMKKTQPGKSMIIRYKKNYPEYTDLFKDS